MVEMAGGKEAVSFVFWTWLSAHAFVCVYLWRKLIQLYNKLLFYKFVFYKIGNDLFK